MSNSSGSKAHKFVTRVACRTVLAACFLALPAMALAQSGGLPGSNGQSFFLLNNPGDSNFNQLLGISDGRVIVGYFGDGTVIANNGYVFVPENHYSAENFTNPTFLPGGDFASETQAIGINNKPLADVVGFYTDNATGFTHGFLDTNGVQSPVDDPMGSAPNVTTPAQNLLGINDFGKAAGFWMDNNGHENGFIVELNALTPSDSTFIEIPPSTFPGGVATQASNITDNEDVCGFWTDGNGNNHGFFGRLGSRFNSFDVRLRGVTVTSTSAFGCNNRGQIVGSFTDSGGNVHGFVSSAGRFFQFDAPGSSQTAAFGVMGTMINAVNDRGDIVGFFSDGTHVNGFAMYAYGEGYIWF